MSERLSRRLARRVGAGWTSWRRRVADPRLTIVVVDDGTAAAARTRDSVLSQGGDDRELVLVVPSVAPSLEQAGVRQVEGDPDDLALARAIGVAAARAPRVLVLPVGQRLVPEALARLLATAPDGGEVVVGRVAGSDHSLSALPLLGRLCAPTTAWRGLDDAGDPEGQLAAVELAARAETRPGDALVRDDHVVVPRGFEPQTDPWPRLDDRVALDDRVLTTLRDPGARAERARVALGRDLASWWLRADAADDGQWARARSHAARLVEVAGGPAGLADVPVQLRVAAWLAADDRRDDLVALVEARRLAGWRFATEVADGEVTAVLETAGLPRRLLVLGPAECRLRSQLRRSVVSEDSLRLEVYAALLSVDQGTTPSTVRAWLDGPADPIELEVRHALDPAVTRWAGERHQRHDAGVLLLEAALADLPPRGELRLRLELEHAGVRRTALVDEVLAAGSATRQRGAAGRTWRWVRGAGGEAVLQVAPAADAPRSADVQGVVVQRATVHGETAVLVVDAPPGCSLALVDGEVRLPAHPDEAGAWRVRLEWGAWGRSATPAPAGHYRLQVERAGHRVPVRLGDALADVVPHQELGEVHRSTWQRGAQGGLVLRLAAPLGDAEAGPFAQQALQRRYREREIDLDPGLVYFQSFSGAAPTDHPAAIQAALSRRLRRDGRVVRVVWGVSDRSVSVPEGTEAVLLRSAEWYDVLARAAYVVTNIELEPWFLRRDGQQVLATYHGHPSKAMGLSQWRAQGMTPSQLRQMLRRTSGTWNILLTPSPEMDVHYRDNYAFDGRIIHVGYPRDDALVAPDRDDVRATTRALLGVEPHQSVLLHAPTWRDDLATDHRRAEAQLYLDVDQAVEGLGPDWVVLLRGHRFHGDLRRSAGGSARVVDVTTYPEVNDLILAADAAVLDYSSIRFDFSLTGRPMVFLVPDLDVYTSTTRGFLFDFAESAPGPLVATTAEVVAELRDLDGLARRWSDTLAAFNARFHRFDDGRAAERVVDELFGPLVGPQAHG